MRIIPKVDNVGGADPGAPLYIIVKKGFDKMKKHPIFVSVLLGALILSVGVSVAYYNTKTFAFDEDAVLFSRDEQGLTVMDYRFDYEIMKKDIKIFCDAANQFVPQRAFSTAPYIVVHFEAPII